VSFAYPSWGFDVAATTGNIGDYNPLPDYGYNYYIDVKRSEKALNKIQFNLIMLDNKSWSTLQISYIATSRDDLTVGNF
jgi:hypothetical protein